MKSFALLRCTSFITCFLFIATSISFASPDQLNHIRFSDTLVADQNNAPIHLIISAKKEIKRENYPEDIFLDVFFAPALSLEQTESISSNKIDALSKTPKRQIKMFKRRSFVRNIAASVVGLGVIPFIAQSCVTEEPVADVLARIPDAEDEELIKLFQHRNWEVAKEAASEYISRGYRMGSAGPAEREARKQVLINEFIMPLVLSLKGDHSIYDSDAYQKLRDLFHGKSKIGTYNGLGFYAYPVIRNYLFDDEVPFDAPSRWGCAYLYQDLHGGFANVDRGSVSGYAIVILIQPSPFELAMELMKSSKVGVIHSAVLALEYIGDKRAVAVIEDVRSRTRSDSLRDTADRVLRALLADVDVTTWTDTQLIEALDQWPDQPLFIQYQVAQELFNRGHQDGIKKARDMFVWPLIDGLGHINFPPAGSKLIELGPIAFQPLLDTLLNFHKPPDHRKWSAYLMGAVANAEQFYDAYFALCQRLDSPGDYRWVRTEAARGLSLLLNRHPLTRERALVVIGTDLQDGLSTAYVRALEALGNVGTTADIPAIERLRDTSTNAAVKDAANDAINKINNGNSGARMGSLLNQELNASQAYASGLPDKKYGYALVGLGGLVLLRDKIMNFFARPASTVVTEDENTSRVATTDRRAFIKKITGGSFVLGLVGFGAQSCKPKEDPADIIARLEETSDDELVKLFKHHNWEVAKAAGVEYLSRHDVVGGNAVHPAWRKEVFVEEFVMPRILSLKGDASVQDTKVYLNLLDGVQEFSYILSNEITAHLRDFTLPFDTPSRWGCAYLVQELSGGFEEAEHDMYRFGFGISGTDDYKGKVSGYAIQTLIQPSPIDLVMKYLTVSGIGPRTARGIINVGIVVAEFLGDERAVGKIEEIRVRSSSQHIREVADEAIRSIMADIDVATWSDPKLVDSFIQWPDMPEFVLFQAAHEVWKRRLEKGIENAQTVLVYPRINKLQTAEWGGLTYQAGQEILELGPICLDPLIDVLNSNAYGDTRKWCGYLIGGVASALQADKAYEALRSRLAIESNPWVKYEIQRGIDWLLDRFPSLAYNGSTIQMRYLYAEGVPLGAIMLATDEVKKALQPLSDVAVDPGRLLLTNTTTETTYFTTQERMMFASA